jgi:CRP-like cAMP-binding protein
LVHKFSGCFEYLLLGRNTTIFQEFEQGDEAYLISKGQVSISKSTANGDDVFTLATLNRGALFGELSLIDQQTRSACAKTCGNTELIVLNRQLFWKKIEQDPMYLKSLLKILCDRLRQVDERAFLYAHGNETDRLQFFINKIIFESKYVKNSDNVKIAKITNVAVAKMAGVSENVAQTYLKKLQSEKKIEINETEILFHSHKV